MIARSERRFFWSILVSMVLIGALPYLVGRLLAPAGSVFYGNTVVAPYDSSIYYSYIEQGRQGHLFMTDVFTSEPFARTLWQPVWYVLGQFANIFHLSAPTAFFLGRLATIPIFITALWWLAGWAFPDQRQRRLAWVIMICAGGVGGIASMLSGQPVYVNGVMPPDLWVTEAYPWLTVWGSPHFLLVSSGIIFVLVGVERSWQQRQWKSIPLIGLVALLTLSIHPFHIITWVATWIVVSVWRWVSSKRFPKEYVWRWVAVAAIASPALAMYGLQLLFDPLTIGRAAQNINPMTPVGLTLIGLGACMLLAPLGAWLWRPRDERWRWAVSLAVTYLFVVYVPLTFQRRLAQGLFIPFALLTVPAILAIQQSIQNWTRWARTLVLGFGLILLSSTWLVVFGFIIKDYVDELAVSPKRMYYLSNEFVALTTTGVPQVPSNRAILATLLEGNVIAGLTAHQVYLGYGVETINFDVKLAQMQQFFGQSDQPTQRNFLLTHGLCYVLDSARARAYGGAFQPQLWPDLSMVWSGPTSSLYYLTSCR
ncbi:MAG: hypothetical protein HY976_03715 [Candidatus Kerfeldbacteria bacterium]|nr:hypothetical protein [Candidatus Kerfeldbacteria bacterium]